MADREVSREGYSSSEYTEKQVREITRMMANVAKQLKDGTSVQLVTKSDGWDIVVWKKGK